MDETNRDKKTGKNVEKDGKNVEKDGEEDEKDEEDVEYSSEDDEAGVENIREHGGSNEESDDDPCPAKKTKVTLEDFIS